MSGDGICSNENTSVLLYALCSRLTAGNEAKAASAYQFACSYLNRFEKIPTASNKDEFYIIQTIKKRLTERKGENAAYHFCEGYSRLQLEPRLVNRANVLTFLLHLSERTDAISSVETEVKEIFTSRSKVHIPLTEAFSFGSVLVQGPVSEHGSKQTSSGPRSGFSRFPPFCVPESRTSVTQLSDSNLTQSSGGEPKVLSSFVERPVSNHWRIGTGTCVSEALLLQDLIYCFQGVDGKFLKSSAHHGFKLDPKVQVTPPTRQLVLRLAELGSLHNQVRSHMEMLSTARGTGLVGESLAAVLRGELTEYYRLIALLQAQVQHQTDMATDSPLAEEQPLVGIGEAMTLRRLSIWVFDPMTRLKCLTAIVHASKDKKGGMITSSIHGFLEHGDPIVQNIARRVLVGVCKPLLVMLSQWILEGELDDPYGEFFIAANPRVMGDMLWHEKYRVLENMIPSFITPAQARKCLATGKSINFLRAICQEQSTSTQWANVTRTLMTLEEPSIEFQNLLDKAYLDTSRRVLDTLMKQYKFMDHLQALRKYMLLGQGDFIRHLMELLEPELGKQASQLYPHNLSSILESAVRATNAQFESEDILGRLDVRTLETSAGDVGWDVFSLDYHVNGPIGTVFAPHMTSYLMLFNTLWHTKRMEWVLSRMWKEQVTSSKMLRRLPELGPLLHQVHLLTSEMVHFVHQMQYYILFEVLECSWDVLIRRVQQAQALDDIIAAHQQFLLTVKSGTLLDENSRDLATQLRAVYDLILQLRQMQEKLHTRAEAELQARIQQDELVEQRAAQGQYGRTVAEDQQAALRKRDFVQSFLVGIRGLLCVIAKGYQTVVRKFLLTLASQSDLNLQLLSIRLDFSEHYKRGDFRLSVPLTYQHRRLSEMGLSVAKSK